MNKVTLKDFAVAIAALAVIVLLVVGTITLLVRLTASSITNTFAVLSTLDAAIVVALITGCVSIVCVMAGAIANNWMTFALKREEYLR